jgi:hypothetical protein
LLVKEDFVLITAITKLHPRKGVIDRAKRQGIDSNALVGGCTAGGVWKRPWIAYYSYFYADLSVAAH